MARIALAILLLTIVCVSAAPQPTAEAYKKLVLDRIGARWYWTVRPHKDKLTSGTIRILLIMGSKGLIKAKVVSNTSDSEFARITLDAIKAAKIPPAPSDALKNGNFEFEVSFAID